MEQNHNLIDTFVAQVFDIDITMLRHRTRKERAAQARFLAFSLQAAQGMDIMRIGIMYDRNKETVRRGIQRQAELNQFDRQFRDRCREVRRLLNEGMHPYDPSLLHEGAIVRTRTDSNGNSRAGTVTVIAGMSFRVESFTDQDFSGLYLIATGRLYLGVETSHDIVLIRSLVE